MTSSYAITISMTGATVASLTGSGYFLYAFGAVQASDQAGLPLVWLQTQGYGATTRVWWAAAYQAFTSTASPPPAAGSSYVPGCWAPIRPGETFVVEGRDGAGAVTGGGTAGTLTILNQTTAPLSCGFAQERPDGSFSPFCVFPLYGLAMEMVVPLRRVLLLFSTVPSPPGTAVAESTGPGVLIDLAGASQRAVSFDIDTGWSWGGAAWAQEIPAGSALVPLLRQPFPRLASGGRRRGAHPVTLPSSGERS